MIITIYNSNTCGDAEKTYYPNRNEVTDAESLKRAVSSDYVCAEFVGNRRGKNRFNASNCLGMDVDNEHSDDPNEWVTPEDVTAAFPGVEFAIVYSRNNMKDKNGKAARPKFHVLFPISEVRDAETYAELKKTVHSTFPVFDKNALDAARFFFGTEDPEVEIHEGSVNLTDFLANSAAENYDLLACEDDGDCGAYEDGDDEAIIPNGKRNATLSVMAIKLLKRYGDSKETHGKWLKVASMCESPLTEAELATIWTSAQRLYAKIKATPDYIPPELYNPVFRLKPKDETDVGQAALLAYLHRNNLGYSVGTGFLAYNGSYWEASKTRALAVVQGFTAQQLEEAEQAIERAKAKMKETGIAELIGSSSKAKPREKLDKKQQLAYDLYCAAMAYRNFVLGRRKSSNIDAVTKQVQPMVEIRAEQLDSDRFLLNTPSSTYDLRVGLSSKREHSPKDYITKQTAVDPSNEGEKLWSDAVNLFFCGDEDLIRYVQMIVGIAIIGRVDLETLIIAYGDGRNGKSTFWDAIRQVLGSYGWMMSADTLMATKKRNIKPELAELRGRRLVVSAELEEGMRLSSSTVKQICSTGEVTAEKKFEAPINFLPSHTIVLYTNHLPKVGELDDGTWRRLIVVPFNAKITGTTEIKNYTAYLFENAGGAILKWAIEGAKLAFDRGFKLDMPAVVEEATKKYREENDWLAHFLEDCCEMAPANKEKSGELYSAYRDYCARIGEYARSTTDFYKALGVVAGFERRRDSSGSMVLGLRLKSEFLNDES